MCRHVCPTFFAWKSDAPTPHGRALLLHQEITGTREIDARGVEVLYQCLECSHCLTWCKPEIDIATLVEEKRRELVKANHQPEGVARIAQLIKETHNPFGEDQLTRNEEITIRNSKGTKILYFTGCTAAYREKDIAQNTVLLLEQLGYTVELSADEWCCGSPLFRTGDHDLGLMAARHNIEVLNRSDAVSILTTCPGCYRALTNDYLQTDTKLNKPVHHISEFLRESIDRLPQGGIEGKVTYHDPCHLGRHSGIYDAPREIIEKVTGSSIVEMERNRENAMCCGNGAGLRTLFPEHAKVIGAERIQHAKNVGARYLVTSCPFCKNILSSQSDSGIEVFDIPEFIIRVISGRYNKID